MKTTKQLWKAFNDPAVIVMSCYRPEQCSMSGCTAEMLTDVHDGYNYKPTGSLSVAVWCSSNRGSQHTIWKNQIKIVSINCCNTSTTTQLADAYFASK